MRLSDHFSLDEMTRTATGLPNDPPDVAVARLRDLCASILEPVRAEWGPVRVDSGFRCPEVNRAVGGVAGSQHVSGEAADIDVPGADLDGVYHWIVRHSGIAFGQCINERRGSSHWVHISLPRTDGKPNREALVYDGHGYSAYAG